MREAVEAVRGGRVVEFEVSAMEDPALYRQLRQEVRANRERLQAEEHKRSGGSKKKKKKKSSSSKKKKKK